MKREELLVKLRELYVAGELSELVRMYTLGSFLLTDSDRKKIDATLKECKHHKLISFALKELDGRII
jgi:hypothetical protein